MAVVGNALVGQSGGPTAVINQTLIGVVESAMAAPKLARSMALFALGILDGQICDFSEENSEEFETVAGTPSSALLSVRLKANKELCVNL